MESISPGRRAGARILVVDDDRDTADSLAALLRQLGHEVDTAVNGEAALDSARRQHPDVVFLDIGMPGMDGYELARRLRGEISVHTRVIALTFLGQEEDRRKSREAGIDQHLLKPVDPVFLESLLGQSVRP